MSNFAASSRLISATEHRRLFVHSGFLSCSNLNTVVHRWTPKNRRSCIGRRTLRDSGLRSCQPLPDFTLKLLAIAYPHAAHPASAEGERRLIARQIDGLGGMRTFGLWRWYRRNESAPRELTKSLRTNFRPFPKPRLICCRGLRFMQQAPRAGDQIRNFEGLYQVLNTVVVEKRAQFGFVEAGEGEQHVFFHAGPVFL
jgi:hypothetical protein